MMLVLLAPPMIVPSRALPVLPEVKVAVAPLAMVMALTGKVAALLVAMLNVVLLSRVIGPVCARRFR